MILPAYAALVLLPLLLLGGGTADAPLERGTPLQRDAPLQRPARHRSAHFTLVAPAGHDMGMLLDEMERAYRDVKAFGLALPANVNARSYGSTDEFVRGSGASRFNLAYYRAEVVHMQPVGLLVNRGELPRALRHEITHVALMKAARKGLPRWLNEGMAMVVAGEMHPETIRFTKLRDLEDTLARSRTHATIRSAYGTAGRLAGALIARFGRQKVLAMLRGVGSAGGFDRAFTTLAGSAPADWARGELKR
jgi:hypothetical protein